MQRQEDRVVTITIIPVRVYMRMRVFLHRVEAGQVNDVIYLRWSDQGQENVISR